MDFLDVVLEHKHAKLPEQATPGSAGYDLTACEETIIQPNARGIVSTGIRITVPEGTYGRIAPRSGLAVKHWIDVCAGVIDRDYTGLVGVVLHNNKNTPFIVHVGDRIAQLILEKNVTPTVAQVHSLEESKRGDDGFGSTGL